MQIHEISLPKKKLITEDRTYLLWESVGRVAGQLSQTPNAVRQRQARAANKAPASTAPAKTTTPPATGGAGSFGQMAQQLTAPTTPATQTSSTGGTTQRTSTGLTHKANPTNPNMAPPAAKPAGYGNYSAGATNPDGTASSQRQADRYTDNLEYQRKQKANTKSTVKESDKYVKRISESWQEYKLDEGIGSAIGGALGKGVGAVKKVGTAVASPFKDVAAGYRSGKIDAKTGAIADKAYRAWSTYRQQLDKSAPNGKADPAMVEKQLLAFVSKNLLGGQYLPNLINKDQIIKLVKQIATTTPSSTGGTTTATSTGLVHKANPANPNQPQPAATTPGAGTFGQMAGQLGANPGAPDDDDNPPPPPGGGGNPPQKMQVAVRPDGSTQAVPEPVKAPTIAPGVRAGKAPSTPAGATPITEPISIGGQKLNPKDPKQAALIAKAQAATKPPIQEAAGPELELFKKLVATAAQAQSEVATGQGSAAPGTAGASTRNSQDPRALAGDVATAEKQGGVEPAVLAQVGKILRDTFKKGDPSVRKTGDAPVDALLLAMGFQL